MMVIVEFVINYLVYEEVFVQFGGFYVIEQGELFVGDGFNWMLLWGVGVLVVYVVQVLVGFVMFVM